MLTTDMSATANNDAELVTASLAGDREAFGLIVSRYQSLICSLAYSATGSLGASEDLAQETFITAWKHLRHLREQHKLRAWLCGIARNRINSTLRREGREPVRDAESLDVVPESASAEPLPHDQTISKEEEAILWRSLERIPEIYREPLVLFYREQQSIAAVANELELTEDNVKQRLSRGRKLLAEEVAAFVEGALTRSNPGKTFTLAVLAALPTAMATSAKAATVGGAIAKGSSAVKGTAAIGSLGGLFATVGALYFSLRTEADNSKSPRERDFMQRMIGYQMLSFMLKVGVLLGLTWGFSGQPLGRDIALAAFFFVSCADGAIFFDFISRRRRQIQIEDGTYLEAEWLKPRIETATEADKAKSKREIFLTLLKVCAFPVIFITVLNAWNSPPDTHAVGAMGGSGKFVGWLVFCAAFVFMLYRGRQRSPRFLAVRPRVQMGAVIFLGLLTLLMFNFHQGLVPTAGTSNTTGIIFNSATVLAYGALAGFLVWKRRKTEGKPF